MQNQKERMPYIDVVKAIAMISVVMFHACTNSQSTYQATNAFLIRFTSAYAMPVFFFVNGFLYKNREPGRPVKMLFKKIKAYYVPLLCYNLFYLFAHNLFVTLHMVDETYGNGFYDLKTFAKHFVKCVIGKREFFGGALWFLGSILFISGIVIVTEFFVYKLGWEKRTFAILGIVVLICLLLGNTELVTEKMKIRTSMANFIYFYFGMLYRHFDWDRLFAKKRMACIVVWAIVNVFISYNKLYNPFTIDTKHVFTVLDYLNAFIGIVAVMQIAQLAWVAKSKTLRVIGRNTLDIMALHFMVFKLISWLMILVYDLPVSRLPEYPVLFGIGGLWWLLYTAVGIVLPTVFSVLRHGWKRIGKTGDVKRV